MKWIAASALAVAIAFATARAQEAAPAPSPGDNAPLVLPEHPSDVEPLPPGTSTREKPSAELITDAAAEAVSQEPTTTPAPADEPLPPLEGKLPGEDNIFGDDLFGPSGAYKPAEPEFPPAPPVIEDKGELERKQRIKFRTVRARLLGDPEVVALEEMAKNAPTPEDHRAARRAYYALLFKKVRKADSSLNDYVDQLEKQSVAGLYQTRIQPTEPLNPPPEPQPDARFIPPREFPDAIPVAEEPATLP